MSIENEVLKKIKSENIKPIPVWRLRFYDFILNSVIIITTILIGIFVSIIFYRVINTDWDLINSIEGRFLETVANFIPVVFIIITVVLFIFLIKFIVTNSGKAYRFRVFSITFVALSVTFLVALICYIIGFTPHAENIIHGTLPIYKDLENQKREFWNHPNYGFIAGKIEEIKNEDLIILGDFKNERWNVFINEVPLEDKFYIMEGNVIKIIGRELNGKTFIARDIRPWEYYLEILRNF